MQKQFIHKLPTYQDFLVYNAARIMISTMLKSVIKLNYLKRWLMLALQKECMINYTVVLAI